MNWEARSSSTEVNDEEPTHSIPANLDDNEPANGRFHRRIAITREIDSCLTSCDQCTGAYEDSVNGYILRVICRHGCHSQQERYAPVLPERSET